MTIYCAAAVPSDWIALPELPRRRFEHPSEVGSDALAILSLVTQRVDGALLDRCPRLQIVANMGVGFDNVAVAEASAAGICVSNTPDVLTDSTADFALALLLAAARRLGEGERMVRAGAWPGWEPTQLLGLDLAGRVLGIVGLGRIGSAVARRARGFAMEVVYAGPEASAASSVAARRVSLSELLTTSDVVSLHCRLTPETRHLIGAAELARMKPTAILVNTARGPIVDEAALAAALREHRIGGAGLDVYEREPEIHPDLLAAPHTVLAPHLGSATTTTRRRMAELCTTAITAVLAGTQPSNLVNPEVWPRRRAV